MNYSKRRLDVIIGENTAERIKKEIGCAMPLLTEEYREIRGRDLYTGLPVVKSISSTEVEQALKKSINKIIESVKVALEQTPPELVSDIAVNGLVVAGGGALIKNIDRILKERLEIPVSIASEPLDCVVNGTKRMLEDINTLKKVAKHF